MEPAQCCLAAWIREGFVGVWIHVYIWLSPLLFTWNYHNIVNQLSDQIRSDQLLSRVQLFATPWIAVTIPKGGLAWPSIISSFSKVKVKVTQPHLTHCHPMDYTVHGILQARILEWVAVPFFRGSSQPRNWTQVSHIAGGFFTSWATREAREYWSG